MSIYRGPSVLGTATDTTHSMVLSAAQSAITTANNAVAAEASRIAAEAARDASKVSAGASAASAASIAAGPVFSVNGRFGTVALTKVDAQLANVDNTADVDKPFSTPQAAAVAAGYVSRTSPTGAMRWPAGTTAQRPVTGVIAGDSRFNNTLNSAEVYNNAGVWAPIGAGATGGGGDAAFVENDALITSPYTLGQGALSPATISVATPAVITQANTHIAGQPVRFTTTGALPTGLDVNGLYYVLATGLSATAFQVSLTNGGAAVVTSGTQSGAHSAGKLKNASITGPFTLAPGVSLTIPNGASLAIL